MRKKSHAQREKPENAHAVRLREHGLRATRERLALMALLERVQEPVGVAELAAMQGTKRMDTVTFYRNLNMLTEAGIVQSVNLRHGHADYELVREHHHHIVCERCGVTAAIDHCPAVSPKAHLIKKSGFVSVRDHALEFFGLCNTCANSTRP